RSADLPQGTSRRPAPSESRPPRPGRQGLGARGQESGVRKTSKAHDFGRGLFDFSVLCLLSSVLYSNNRLTDSLKWIRLMASARSGATLRTLICGSCLSGVSGIVSV